MRGELGASVADQVREAASSAVIRVKRKRLVNCQILTEAEPGLFTLTRKRT